jgi:hypothetical protein
VKISSVRALATIAQPTGKSRNGGVRPGRYGAYIFHITKEARKVDLGRRTRFPVTYGNELLSRARKIGPRAIHRRANATRPLDPWRAGKQYLVGRGLRQPSGCESVPAAVLHQLQFEKGLVSHLAAHSDSELGSCQRQPMDGPVWRRSGKNHETRIPTCVAYRTVLWQRCPSREYSGLDHAVTNCVPVPQVNEGGAEDAVGEKTETDGRATATVQQTMTANRVRHACLTEEKQSETKRPRLLRPRQN